MSIGRIAVITADTKLAELCKLEISLAGYEAYVFSSLKHLNGNYFKYLYDIDTVEEETELPEDRTVRLSSKSRFNEDASHLRLPISLKKLQKVICSSGAQNNVTYEYSKPDTLILLSKESRVLAIGEHTVTLSEYELRILEYLCARRGNAVKREVLNELLGASDGNIADVYVCHLRKKLDRLCGHRMIATVRSQGYKIDVSLKYAK